MSILAWGLCRPRVAALFALPFVLVSCFEGSSTGSTDLPGQEPVTTSEPGEQQPSLECDASVGEQNGFTGLDLCIADAGGGFEVLATRDPRYSEDISSVLVVDIGGPQTDRSLGVEGLRLVVGHTSPNTTVVTIVPPEPGSLSQDCISAKSSNIVDVCNLESIAASYTTGYAAALDRSLTLMGLQGREVNLVGTSYAAARWAQIFVADGPAPKFDRVVIAQPFAAGLSGERLEEEAFNVARQLYASAIYDSCVIEDCLSLVGSSGIPCQGRSCAPENELGDMSGMTDQEVLEGLAGLAPLVTDNAAQLEDAFNRNDRDAVKRILEQGRTAYLGRDQLGGLKPNEVHFLAAICPVLVDSELGSRYELCGSVPRSPLITDGLDDELADAGKSPEEVCFLATGPDPILGRASSYGILFGQTSERTAVPGRLGHGDVALAASVLSSSSGKQTTKHTCGIDR